DSDFEEQLKEDVKILLTSYSSIDNPHTLIDKAKNLLANVDQAPSKSMQDALLTSMKALVTNEFFRPNCYYMKEVSILDTVAKVQSCLVMMDLECDALIVEMFQIFFKIIRSIYSLVVFSAMETIVSGQI
ncbi:hypothetical protein CFP56_032886, partial [Quercus suber]